MPVHWDSLFKVEARLPQSYLRPRLGWPPLVRVNLTRFAEMIARLAPETRVVIPETDKTYEL